jgi:tRNA-specific 2-thiouridylase
LLEANWLAAPLNGAKVDCAVKIRSTMEPEPASVRATGDGRVEVTFAEPQYGVSPGQACVAYDGDRVLGGGWIERQAAR